MGVLDDIKAILSPAGACLWAELGNTRNINNMGLYWKLVAHFDQFLILGQHLPDHCKSKPNLILELTLF